MSEEIIAAPEVPVDPHDHIFNTSREMPTYTVSNKYAGLNVLGLVADNSACGYYRVVNPLHYLRMNGANVEYGSYHSMDNFMKYDFILAPRQHSEEVYEILRYIMWEGKTVIFEVDDDLDAVQPSSPAYFAYHHGSPELKMIHKVMSWCDGVTTTTREMAKWCSQNNRNVGILENLIDFSFRDWNAEVTYDDNQEPIIKPLPVRKCKEWEGKTVVGWSGGTCWDSETEVLTQDGWVKAPLVNKDHRIATLNPSNDTLEYHNPSEVVSFTWDGEMHHYRNGHVDMLITPNHWTWSAPYQKVKDKANFQKIQSQSLFGQKFWAKKDCIWNAEVIESISIPGAQINFNIGEWVEFFGYWVRDGWTSSDQKQVGLCQYKDNNILLRAEVILTKAGFKITKRPNEILVCNKEFGTFMAQFGEAKTKQIPSFIKNMSSEYLRILLDAYIQTDGHIEKTGTSRRWRAWTSSKQLADDLTEIALKIGWAANITTRPSKDGLIDGRVLKSSGPSYQVSFLKSDGDRNFLTPLVSEKCQSRTHYKGNVYCVTVKNHLVYTRRNGKACWTHNTHQEDLKILGPQIKSLLLKHPKMHFAMYASPSQAEEFVNQYALPEDRYTLVPARHFVDHPTGLHGVDIYLAPLACNQFNLAKSHLKCLESMVVGAAMVTSNVGPYARFNTRHPGYIINTGQGAGCKARNLIEGVEFLLENPDELRELQIKGRQLIFDRYSLEKNIDSWPATWNYIRNQKHQGNLGPPEEKKPKKAYVAYQGSNKNDPCPCQSGLTYAACCKDAWG